VVGGSFIVGEREAQVCPDKAVALGKLPGRQPKAGILWLFRSECILGFLCLFLSCKWEQKSGKLTVINQTQPFGAYCRSYRLAFWIVTRDSHLASCKSDLCRLASWLFIGENRVGFTGWFSAADYRSKFYLYVWSGSFVYSVFQLEGLWFKGQPRNKWSILGNLILSQTNNEELKLTKDPICISQFPALWQIT
jgi:hypothetical protein